MKCFHCGFYDFDYETCTCPAPDLIYACPNIYQEDGTDLQLGKYDIEVMNGDGYYDDFGNFVRYRSDDDWWSECVK